MVVSCRDGNIWEVSKTMYNFVYYTDFHPTVLNKPVRQTSELVLEQCTTRAPPTSFLVRMIEQILTMNNFEFNGEHYLQIQGTAMGMRMAPSYANIFMGRLESQLLQQTTNRPSTWWRFIDDTFCNLDCW